MVAKRVKVKKEVADDDYCPRKRRGARKPRIQKTQRRSHQRSPSSSSAASVVVKTPPPTTPPAIEVVVGDCLDPATGFASPISLSGEKPTDCAKPPPQAERPPCLIELAYDLNNMYPPPPVVMGPVCESRTRTSFSFAGHLDNRTQWQLLHQALVTYMFEMNMSPQIAWHHHHIGSFRGLEQDYTTLNIVTGSTWTNVFESDMEGLIRMVWDGRDRHFDFEPAKQDAIKKQSADPRIEVCRSPHTLDEY